MYFAVSIADTLVIFSLHYFIFLLFSTKNTPAVVNIHPEITARVPAYKCTGVTPYVTQPGTMPCRYEQVC